MNSPGPDPGRPQLDRKIPSRENRWMRSFPESTTRSDPPGSIARDRGSLNCPSPRPGDPQAMTGAADDPASARVAPITAMPAATCPSIRRVRRMNGRQSTRPSQDAAKPATFGQYPTDLSTRLMSGSPAV